MPTKKETEMEVGGWVQRKNTWQSDEQIGTNKSIFYKYLFKFVRDVTGRKEARGRLVERSMQRQSKLSQRPGFLKTRHDQMT